MNPILRDGSNNDGIKPQQLQHLLTHLLEDVLQYLLQTAPAVALEAAASSVAPLMTPLPRDRATAVVPKSSAKMFQLECLFVHKIPSQDFPGPIA